jgi:pimeloyl-ACP methyl ester carboxylesterase
MGLAALIAGALLAASSAGANAQAPDPTLYCQGDGGPLGVATDLEHNVLVGDPALPAGVRTKRVIVNGVGTRVVQAGPADAEDAVVFIHGNPSSARDWDELVAANGAFARTVAFDVPGFGKSDKDAPQIQSTVGLAGYIQRLFDELGIRRAVLVLHDFGGPWGLQWAMQHPDALSGAVLINTGFLFDYVPHPGAVIWFTPVVGESYMASQTRASFKAVTRNGGPHTLPEGVLDRWYDDFDRPERCAILRFYRNAGFPDTVASRQAAVLRRRRRPALVIWGEHDPYIPATLAYRQQEGFPGARVVVFSDSGHWTYIDNAARTRALVVPFLRPRLTVRRPSVAAGQGHVRTHIRIDGVLPAYEVRARLDHANLAGDSVGFVGDSRPSQTVSGRRVLVISLRRPLRSGRYALSVHARGLPPWRELIRVPAKPPGRGGSSTPSRGCRGQPGKRGSANGRGGGGGCA